MMATARIIIILIAGVFVMPSWAQLTSRIWGGEEAAKNSFPYVASVRVDGAHICGGTIIGTKSVLTAAHCVVENGNFISPSRLAVRVGSTNQFSGGKLLFVSTVSVHPNYAEHENDIAVLTLKLPLEWTERVAMIDIASTAKEGPKAGDSVLVAGWGQQSTNATSYKLHSMLFSIATEDVCSQAINKKDKSSICLMHDLKKGSCTGDAGNGGVYNNKLIGVSSYVVGACGSRYPDIFMNVAYFASWIKTVMG